MMCENKASEVIAKGFDSVVSKGLKKMKKCGEIEKNSGDFSVIARLPQGSRGDPFSKSGF